MQAASRPWMADWRRWSPFLPEVNRRLRNLVTLRPAINACLVDPLTTNFLPAVPFLGFSGVMDVHTEPLPVARFASHSMASPLVIVEPSVLMPIFAPCAGIRAMGRRPVPLDHIFPLSTPLRADHWQHALAAAQVLDLFAEVPKGLCEGFDIGINSLILSHSYYPRNHYRTAEAHDFLVSKYCSEVALGRVLPGFNPAFVEHWFGAFRTAPLNVIRGSSGKLRVTLDLSFPRNNSNIPSVNSFINSDNFPCDWGTFAACWLLVAKAPPGSEVAVFDVDSAFRNIPTRPQDWLKLAVSIDGNVHFDFRLNFGAASAPGIFGHVADAIVAIYRHRGVDDVLKWVDDFIFFRYPISQSSSVTFSYDETLIRHVALDLGWPWSDDKHSPFASTFTYIGFSWSLDARMVELPEKKHYKYLNKLNEWSRTCRVSLKMTESLIGTLNHVCLVLPVGRSHLPSLFAFRA